MRLQALAFESCLSEMEPAVPLAFGHDPAKTLDDKSLQGCPLQVGQLASLLKEAVGYLYGCGHVHINLYAGMSSSLPSSF